ncbi:hypothetical protein [Acetobacter tropicalis]|uniref:hypothetical protein n=1 Tax=Acetobacter tropicalis TaxID=104102 RepID=UPI0012FDBEEF|nr:hypothetical protein [Acetobacter tropicalis]
MAALSGFMRFSTSPHATTAAGLDQRKNAQQMKATMCIAQIAIEVVQIVGK